MFGNLTVESEVRRTNAPSVKIDVDPEVTNVVKAAWGKQLENERDLGHTVDLGTEELVAAFHEHARAASAEHEPRLKYRKLGRVGKDTATTKAFFAVTKWVEKPKVEKPVDPAPAVEPEPEAPVKAAARATKAAK